MAGQKFASSRRTCLKGLAKPITPKACDTRSTISAASSLPIVNLIRWRGRPNRAMFLPDVGRLQIDAQEMRSPHAAKTAERSRPRGTRTISTMPAAMPSFGYAPTKPFGVPQIWSFAFWGGVWGLIFGLVERWFPQGPMYYVAAFLFGAIAPKSSGWSTERLGIESTVTVIAVAVTSTRAT